MATPDMDVIKEIPGYKVILKAILKSQIQQLVEQLASHTDEESVILTASVSDGTLCHLGSDSGKSFLEDHEDIKSQFLGFCLKRHHRRKQVEKEKTNMPMARGPPMLPTHLGPGPGTRPPYNRSPRIPYPRQAMPRHSMSPGGGLSSIRSPAMRHEPYPTSHPIRRASLDSAGEAGGLLNHIPLKLPLGGMSKVENQVIKIEAMDSPENSNNANDSELTSQLPSSSHSSPSLAAMAADNDEKSNSSSSTIPNEPIDTKLNIEGLGSVSGDQDVNSDSVAAKDSADPTSVSNTSTSGVDIDPDINVKVEAITETEMELEITGVEPGKMPVVGSVPQDNWVPDGQGGMYDPSGAMGNPEDMQAYNNVSIQQMVLGQLQSRRNTGPLISSAGNESSMRMGLMSPAGSGSLPFYLCGHPGCNKTLPSKSQLDIHMRIHTGERPFQCKHCRKTYSQSNNLYRHIRSSKMCSQVMDSELMEQK